MSLNENNFLRFTGTSTAPAYTISATSTTDTLFANVEYLDTYPLSSSSASLGIDNDTFYIYAVEDTGGTPVDLYAGIEWDATTGRMRIFRPIDLSVTDIVVRFYFKDYAGNQSSNIFCQIAVSAVVVSWVVYPASATCSLDVFGVNNGFLQWAQLKLINSGTLADISPLTLKANISSDPDYIAPITDLGTCPTTIGTYAPLRISNFSKNGANPVNDFINITQITLACSACGFGGTPLLINIPCFLAPGTSQSFSVPAVFWDTGLTISYEVNPGGTMVGLPQTILWKSQSMGVVDNFPTGGPAPVDDSGIYGNFSITVNPIYGTTIFCQ